MADKPADTVGKVIRDFEADLKPQDQYARNVDAWYRAYRGVIELRSKAADWTSKLHPPYVFQVVETLTANVVDPRPRWRVRPRAVSGNADYIQMLTAGARANELLLSEQIDQDCLAEKQMLFAKQAFIAGLSVYKTQWLFAERDVPQQSVVRGEVQGIPVNQLGTTKVRRAVRDNNTAEVVDVRDWIPQEGAVSLDRCARVTHRVYYSMDELRQLEAQGAYGVRAGGQPVDTLKDSRDFTGENSSREQELFNTNRTKGKVEVLEQWRRNADGSLQLVAVANRSVLLRNTPSPFWHGQFPFAVCTPVPDLGRIPGISVVEQICDLQEAAWSFLNQRIDNTELINNAIVLIREDADNLDQFEWAPGAQWIVPDPQQVTLLPINAEPAQVSLAAEEKIKEDLQNIPGASPTLLGQTDQNTNTATEVSLSTTLAQRRISLMKQQFKWSYAQVGLQWLANNQQFVTSPRLVQRIGADSAAAWEEIHPLLIQGEFLIDLDSLDESLMRQERRAEKQAMLQVALNAAQFFAAIPNMPGLNLKAFMDEYLDAFDITDKERFYSAAQQPQLPQPGQQGQQGQPSEPGGGLTAPQAYDATSPSNATSLSPMAAMQRMGSMAGGPVNGG